jgi:uncharacterized protein
VVKSKRKSEINMKKYTLITGASSGLGIDFAHEYAKKNNNLILVARRVERLNQLKEELNKKYDVDVIVYPMDLNHQTEINRFFETLNEEIFINRLINNAGFGHSGPFSDMQEETIVSMNRVNIEALSLLSYKVLPKMKAHKEGEILNVGSIAGFVAGPFMAEYYATKAYVLNFSLALHEELKPFNIKVSVLCPGPTKTEFFDVANSHKDSSIVNGFMMDSLPVVQKGISDVEKNKPISIVGLSNHTLRFLLKLTPRTVAAKFIARIQSKD